MRHSCGAGKTVYELDGKYVITHDLTEETELKQRFKDSATALEYYQKLTGVKDEWL